MEHGKGAGGIQTAAVTASAVSWKHTPDAGAGAALTTEPSPGVDADDWDDGGNVVCEEHRAPVWTLAPRE